MSALFSAYLSGTQSAGPTVCGSVQRPAGAQRCRAHDVLGMLVELSHNLRANCVMIYERQVIIFSILEIGKGN